MEVANLVMMPALPMVAMLALSAALQAVAVAMEEQTAVVIEARGGSFEVGVVISMSG